jgi:hypothetical protein
LEEVKSKDFEFPDMDDSETVMSHNKLDQNIVLEDYAPPVYTRNKD